MKPLIKILTLTATIIVGLFLIAIAYKALSFIFKLLLLALAAGFVVFVVKKFTRN